MAKLHYAFVAFLLVLPLYLCNAHSHHHSRESHLRHPPPMPHSHYPAGHHHLPPVHHPMPGHHHPHGYYPPPHHPHVMPGHGHGPSSHHPLPPHSHHHSPSVSLELGSRHHRGRFSVVL
ncbi:hypothetical protein M514_22860 [Trichuris suis]|uniref:Histidine-rich glycoprotein n=1 Tax=Trichuris suis TaxID=68888 RepID=A0A085MT70_9BILA|nr:hypothetical protein M513_03216 [Trichuris suis]KFD59331.1 hypothetical protein M514_03216 [Trichuris suis]KFD60416.1 hypothetical protein M514_27409 [Trichuris suis]KFD65011.1 hypothetical protein M514_22860 [Trichuris suis]